MPTKTQNWRSYLSAIEAHSGRCIMWQIHNSCVGWHSYSCDWTRRCAEKCMRASGDLNSGDTSKSTSRDVDFSCHDVLTHFSPASASSPTTLDGPNSLSQLHRSVSLLPLSPKPKDRWESRRIPLLFGGADIAAGRWRPVVGSFTEGPGGFLQAVAAIRPLCG